MPLEERALGVGTIRTARSGTGVCATPDCRLPAQPGRDHCAECLSAAATGNRPAHRRKRGGAGRPIKLCADCGKPTDTGGNGQRKRCVPCAVKYVLARKKTLRERRAAQSAPQSAPKSTGAA